MIKEFQYPDGWYMRVGQVYSSPYEANHFLVTRFEQDDAPGINNILVYFKEVNSNNYDEILVGNEQRHRAWYVNEGNWDLEVGTTLVIIILSFGMSAVKLKK
jgi:hypothetical protein